MKFFTELGDRIDTQWQRAHYAMDVLPALASDLVASAEAPRHVDPMEVIRWVPTTKLLPLQRDIEGSFGNPPVTVYRNAHFSIDVLFWLDGNTSIHDHAFWGVWQVFAGASLHCTYDFAAHERYGERFATGALTLKGTEILRAGDVREIRAGSSFIHGLFHLERPSVSLLVRTDRVGTTQLNYYYPGVAQAPDWRPPQLARTMQCFAYVKSARSADFVAYAADAVERTDAHSLYWLLRRAVELLENDVEGIRALFDRVREAHGRLGDLLFRKFSKMRRDAALVQQRRALSNADHRFFLALLLNVQSSEALLALVQGTYSGEGREELVVRWTRELWGGQKTHPALQLPEITDASRFVLREMLRGEGADSIQRALPSALAVAGGVPALVRAFRASILGVAIPPERQAEGSGVVLGDTAPGFIGAPSPRFIR